MLSALSLTPSYNTAERHPRFGTSVLLQSERSPSQSDRLPAAQALKASHSSISPEQAARAMHYKESGNQFLRLRLYPQAIQAYQLALQSNPAFTDAYYNLAQVFKTMGHFPQAIGAMTQMLFINPNDHDGRVSLGEFYESMGQPQLAKRLYMQVLKAQPYFDPARRNLFSLLHQDQVNSHPDTARQLHETTEGMLIAKTRQLLKQYYRRQPQNGSLHPQELEKALEKTDETIKRIEQMPLVFEATQTQDNTPNIAEYDALKNVIRLQPKMLFSSANVVAAYVAHEMVHALDRDSHTSVQEEQEGYRELANFWRHFKGDTIESNLDRALSLYEKGKSALDEEVRKLYTMRSPSIAERSPGHGLPKASAPESPERCQEHLKEYQAKQKQKWLEALQGLF